MAHLPISPGGRRYGWKKQKADPRDRKLLLLPEHLANLPPAFDLRSSFPDCYQQSVLGSCTANAIAGEIQHQQISQGIPNFTPSRLFVYYGERASEGTIDQDAGAEIRDGMTVVSTLGAPPETDWPYDTSQFTVQPPPIAYADGLNNLVTSYEAVPQDLDSLRTAIVQGYGVVFGFNVPASFESDVVTNTGIMPMPTPGESILGGHAVVAAAYDNSLSAFWIRNSWGCGPKPDGWGVNGYFQMPFDFITDPNWASDFWVVKVVA